MFTPQPAHQNAVKHDCHFFLFSLFRPARARSVDKNEVTSPSTDGIFQMTSPFRILSVNERAEACVKVLLKGKLVSLDITPPVMAQPSRTPETAPGRTAKWALYPRNRDAAFRRISRIPLSGHSLGSASIRTRNQAGNPCHAKTGGKTGPGIFPKRQYALLTCFMTHFLFLAKCRLQGNSSSMLTSAIFEKRAGMPRKARVGNKKFVEKLTVSICKTPSTITRM